MDLKADLQDCPGSGVTVAHMARMRDYMVCKVHEQVAPPYAAGSFPRNPISREPVLGLQHVSLSPWFRRVIRTEFTDNEYLCMTPRSQM